VRSEASGAGCGQRDVDGRQCNMNEYSAPNFLVVGDAVECNTRPKATLRSLFVFFLFFLMATDESKEVLSSWPTG
jgi:hypothetical protein